MALEKPFKIFDDTTPKNQTVGTNPFPDVYGGLRPHTGPIFYASADVLPPVVGVVPQSGQILIDETYKLLGLEPTHGGYLPKGYTGLAGTWFAPQPIGIVDPAAYGFHHDWLLGVTYDRLALLYTNPELLDRKIADQQRMPHLSAPQKRISGPQDVTVFDYPFLVFGGGLDYTSQRTAPLQRGGTLTEEERAVLRFESELTERLGEFPPGLYPAVYPSGQRVVVQVDVIGDVRLITDPAQLPKATFDPNAVKPTNLPAKINGDKADPPNDQMITERADP